MAGLFKKMSRLSSKTKQLLDDIPHIAGAIAVEETHKNFDAEGYRDGKTTKWKGRKNESKKSKGKNLLVNEGVLKGSIDYDVEGRNTHVGSDEAYAQVHNEGGKSGRGAGFIMPKRQYLGFSREVQTGIHKAIDKRMDEIFKHI